ncbi:MAG: type II toxin-antitoxin system VapC family toxin [Patescibacteria group bacterium]
MRTFVIDSSICLKWTLSDEIDSDKASDIQEMYVKGEFNLIAPDLWLYEVINGIKSVGLKKKLIPESKLTEKLLDLIKSQPNLMSISDIPEICLKNSLEFGISGYDSAYITLARVHGLTLITADEKLARKVNNPKLAISLKEFKIK